jgi:ferredoxin
MAVRVWIDADACVGNGVCIDACPDMFMLDGGTAYVLHNGRAVPGGTAVEVPDHLLDGVIEAAEECPPSCIYLETA